MPLRITCSSEEGTEPRLQGCRGSQGSSLRGRVALGAEAHRGDAASDSEDWRTSPCRLHASPAGVASVDGAPFDIELLKGDGDVTMAYETVRASTGMDLARKLAGFHAQRAVDAICRVAPDSEARDALISICYIVLSRNK